MVGVEVVENLDEGCVRLTSLPTAWNCKTRNKEARRRRMLEMREKKGTLLTIGRIQQVSRPDFLLPLFLSALRKPLPLFLSEDR